MCEDVRILLRYIIPKTNINLNILVFTTMANKTDHIPHPMPKYREEFIKLTNIILDMSFYTTTICSFFLIAFNPFKYGVLFSWQFILYMFFYRMCAITYNIKVMSIWAIPFILLSILGFYISYNIINTAFNTNIYEDNKYLIYAIQIIPLIAGISIWSFYKSEISQYLVRLFTLSFGILLIFRCIFNVYCSFYFV